MFAVDVISASFMRIVSSFILISEFGDSDSAALLPRQQGSSGCWVSDVTLSADCISVAICSTWTSLVVAVLPDCVSSGPSVFFFFAVGLVSPSSS